MSEYKKFKVAAAQAAPVFLNKKATTDKACKLILEAGANGAKVIGFPEGFIPTHPYWFIIERIRNRTTVKYDTELLQNAVQVPGPEVEQLGEAAKRAAIYVVIGLCEKGKSAGTLYNTQLFFGPEGNLLGKHQKLVPTLGERLVHAPGQRSYAPDCFDTDLGGALGGLICGEHFNTLARYSLIAKGELIHVGSWPANFSAEGHRAMQEARGFVSRSHAFEGKLFVISVAGVMTEEFLSALCDSKEKRDFLGTRSGGSAIIGPKGDYITEPLFDEERIVYGQVDVELAMEQKITHDIAGHYQRADVYTVMVDRKDPTLLIEER
jgi:aliphatic nitrilase